MAFISGIPTIGEIDLYQTNATVPSGLSVGQIVVDPIGRYYRYGLVGASALVMGNLLQSSVEDTTYENMAVGVAGSVGDYFLSLTNGTATITAQQFAGGSITVYTAGTVAIGDEYTILGVTGTLTTGGAITVQIDRPLRAAFTTSAKVNMKRSPYSGMIQFPATTPTGIPVGGAIWAATAAQYAFVQTHGIGAVLSDGSTFAVGSAVGTPSGTAGAITVYAAATTKTLVGDAQQAAAAAHAISINWRLD